MRQLFVFLVIVIFYHQTQAQTMKPFNYEKQWKSVEDLIQKGLNQSAEKEIKVILSNARQEKNTEEYIRALCSYRVSLRDREEESRLIDIKFFHEELKTASFPAKQILYSMLAELYWSYYNEHRYKILDLTTVATSSAVEMIPDPQADITTWTANQFYQATYACYQASLQEKSSSQQFALGKLQRILDPGQNSEKLRPTLYDFLVFRALEFYQSEESELTLPSYQFEINDAMAFASSDQFVNHKFTTPDSLSKKFIALLLFQDVLRFHAKDQDPAASIDADILRIRFVHDFSVHPDKNKMYIDALKRIYQTYPKVPEAAMARFYHAETFAQGDSYLGRKAYMNGINQESQLNYLEAHKMASEIIQAFPNTEASYQAQILIAQIESQILQLQMEKVILPQKPALVFVNYRNVSRFYYKVVALSHEDYKKYRQYYYEHSAELAGRKAYRNETVDLPVTADYKTHSTEIKLDGLPVGSYLIVSSVDPEFSKKAMTSFSFIQVTNMTFLSTPKIEQQAKGIWVLHRESGQPMPGVTVKFWKNEYNYKTYKNENIEFQTRTSDQKGFVALEGIDNNINLLPELIQGQDRYFTGEGVPLVQETETVRSFDRTFLFTDRSIYRPGQTIYFKGIMVHSEGSKNLDHGVIPSRKTSVSLYDVNGQVVETKEFQTNSYGAFSGQFTAPMGLLTGSFRLQAEGGQSMVQIEEYKRPAFEVVLDTFKDSYRLNEEIKVKGRAIAYAGNALDGATVKYRVTRNARFPYYWCNYAWGLPTSPAREITHGTITTKSDGSFEFIFKAEPDFSVDKRSMPVFDYTIHVDVTDVQTETRSAETQLPVAYQALLLKVNAAKMRSVNDFNALEVFSTNMSGVYVPTDITLSLKKLDAPNRIYRERSWSKPEILSIPEATFRKDFPLDAYGDENNPLQWKAQKTAWTQRAKTTSNGVVYLPKTGSGDGWYILEVKAIDLYGEEIQEKHIIRLYTGDKPTALPNEALVMELDAENYEPGEKSICQFASAFQSVHLFYLVDRLSGSSLNLEMIEGARSWTYPINEKDRGGFYINTLFVKDNRVYRAERHIEVPYSNKELQVSVETFRDKMLPGSEQEWKLHIRGSKKEIVSAEVLATMYDASLDAFRKHSWSGMQLFGANRRYFQLGNPIGFLTEQSLQMFSPEYPQIKPYLKSYPQLKWWDLNQSAFYGQRFAFAAMADEAPMAVSKSPKASKSIHLDANERKDSIDDMSEDQEATSMEGLKTPSENQGLRTNLQETAFFMPHLQTNAAGDLVLNFKAPEALTKWKMMAFAHTTSLAEGQKSETSITQKEIMIMPNTPRFLREGDEMEYVAKVVNLSSQELELESEMEILNAHGTKNLNDLFKMQEHKVRRRVKPGGSVPVSWKIKIPADYYEPVLVRTSVRNVEANSSFVADGEQHLLPVLVNSMLVTETLPMPVRPNTTRQFKMASLLNSNQSATLRQYNLSVEYTTNPAWYAIQSLPYLTDYPYECAEQTFNRYYANALAAHIANSNPKLNEIFSKWKNMDSAALLSNLQKNQELKNALLEETPWVMQANSEAEQKKNVAILFDVHRMTKELERTTRELAQMQTPNGGFTWFKGMPEDRFITQYILTGLGRLIHLGVQEIGNEQRITQLIERALPYLDMKLKEDYNNLLRNKANLNEDQIGYTQIQYLYMRSFFKEQEISAENQKAFNFYKQQAAKYWLKQNKFMQALSALALSRFGVEKVPAEIIASLRENAIRKDETGMYWKEMQQSMWWYEAPIEAQSVMIEAFKEVAKSEPEVDELKIWLLKNKQTTHWKTTKATADACYALLLNGSYWLAAQPDVQITLGGQKINNTEETQEAGTGYFKKSFSAANIQPDMGNIQVKVQSAREVGTTWGALYWQYFENLDQIKASDDKMPLTIRKKLFRVNSTASGEVLVPVNDQDELQSGDKVIVRIEIKVDHSMEYVHLKDMRGACFEPLNVLSQYKYQSGLGYYESTRDIATNFFFQYLHRGNYVFEYPLLVSTKGNYSNGIARIQCMYAPEFSSHSEGIRVRVR